MREEGWLWLASHLHKGLQEVKRITTSSEFVLWMHYREYLNNAFSKDNYYLAQICTVIAKSVGNNKVTIEDFLLHFKTKEELTELENDDEEIDEDEEMYKASNMARGMVQGAMGGPANNNRGRGGDISIPKVGE